MLLSKPLASLITFFRTSLINFYLNSQRMSDSFYHIKRIKLKLKLISSLKLSNNPIWARSDCIDWRKSLRDKNPFSARTGLEKIRSLVRSPARPILFPRIDDSRCNRIHSSLTALHCFDNG